MEATLTSIDRWTDKEVVAHIHNGILLSHKKECIWVSSNEVDEPRAITQSEVSQKEKKTNIIYEHIYMDLESWYWWAYLQSRKKDADTENRLCAQQGEKRVGRTERIAWRHTLPCGELDSQWEFAVRHRELKSDALWWPREAGWGRRRGEGSRERGHIRIYGWCMLLYGRNQQNIVKQLSSN